MTRLTRDEYGLKLAEAAALRADCTRRQVGAVIVAPDGSVVSTGYNGLAAGKPGCLSAGACPRGQLSYAEQPAAVSYEETGCRAVHAEVNAVIRAGRDRCIGATIYVTDEPCFHCSVVIEGAGIVRGVTPLRWSQEETESVVHPALVEVPVVIGDAEPVTGTVTDGVLTIPRAASTSGPLDPEILAALQRQEERVKAIKSAEATRAELAKRHEGWQP